MQLALFLDLVTYRQILLEPCDKGAGFAAATRKVFYEKRAVCLTTIVGAARWTLLVSSLSTYRYFFILGFVIEYLQPNLVSKRSAAEIWRR